jgi:hypothetical protein
MMTLKEIEEYMKRFATEDEKKRFRVVWAEMNRLRKRVADLEKIHDKHMAPQMFKEKPSSNEILIQAQIEKRRKELEQPKQFFPLKERLKLMIQNGKKGSDEWNKTLKWNRLTEDKVELMLKEGEAK